MRTASRALLCVLFTVAVLQSPVLAADQRQAADLLPESVVLYAEIPRPKELLAQILDHPIYRQVAESAAYQQALQQPQVVQARAAVAVVELQIGRTWRNALEALLENGVAIAVDSKTNGVAMVVHTAEPGLLEKTRDVILNLAREDGKRKGNNDPVKTTEYRGVSAFELQQAKFATFGEWFVATNNGDLGKSIIDRYLDNSGGALTAQPRFQQARQQVSSSAALWAFVDVETLRTAGVAQDALGGKAKDPAGELLLGGLLANLAQTPLATAELKLDHQSASLVLATPHDPTWIAEEREYFFGPQGQGRAPQLLLTPNTILSLGTYRDVSGMWLRAGDLFNKEVNDQLATADSTLTTLFSGRDFGEDILGAVHPELQLVVARQTFAANQPQPSIKLPAFALVARLKEPERMRTELRRIFQSLVGFLNVAGATNGQPQLDLSEERGENTLLVTASYAPDVDRPTQADAKINYNFSPCLAFSDSHVILASTANLARELLSAAPTTGAADPGVNTIATANVAALRETLLDNRSHLVSQNMLESGHTREEAEREIDTLFAVLDQLRTADLRFRSGEQLKLELTVSFKSAEQ